MSEQSDPIISLLADQFFGKKGQQLDVHGANLACWEEALEQPTTMFNHLINP